MLVFLRSKAKLSATSFGKLLSLRESLAFNLFDRGCGLSRANYLRDGRRIFPASHGLEAFEIDKLPGIEDWLAFKGKVFQNFILFAFCSKDRVDEVTSLRLLFRSTHNWWNLMSFFIDCLLSNFVGLKLLRKLMLSKEGQVLFSCCKMNSSAPRDMFIWIAICSNYEGEDFSTRFQFEEI